MKSTGMLRRIDELGRIVIPKEIRNNLRLMSGEEMEIYLSGEDIVLKKFSKLGKLEVLASDATLAVSNSINSYCFVSDLDNIVASSGAAPQNITSTLTEDYLKELQHRKFISYNGGVCVSVAGETEAKAVLAVPLIVRGDLIGSLGVISYDVNFTANELSMLKLACTILSSIM